MEQSALWVLRGPWVLMVRTARWVQLVLRVLTGQLALWVLRVPWVSQGQQV